MPLPYSRAAYLALPGADTVWVWEGLLPAAGRTLLIGEPKIGKSFLALGLAEAVADPAASTFCGQPIRAHGPVLYVQLDTPRSLWRAQYVAHTRPLESLYFLDREMPDIPSGFDIRRDQDAEWLAAYVATCRPVVVVVDTLRAVHYGDENDSAVAHTVLTALTQAVAPASLLLVAHDNKPTTHDTRSAVSRFRGSSAFTGAVDGLLYLTSKGISVSARSDIDTLDARRRPDGFWEGAVPYVPHLDTREAVQVALATCAPGASATMQDRAIAKALDCSPRTARRYRTLLAGSAPQATIPLNDLR